MRLIRGISDEALKLFQQYSWPGNVRELQNVLTRAIVLSNGDLIELADLGLPKDGFFAEEQSFRAMKTRAIQRFEHDFLATIMYAHGGNITRAASAVKKNRRAFWQLLRKHDMLAGARRG